uniref:Uncharacterized protein n=1 Tax=Arundo donax TaxID=35708 RepID=A0A0A9D3B1_ARUDO
MKLNSRVSISSGVRFCCSSLFSPETGSNSEYSCIRSSNWRRYQARMVYSTFLHSFKNSLRSTSCSMR